MGGAGTSPPPRRPAATRGAVGARGAYVTCQVSIQVCFEIYSRFETSDFTFQWGGGRPDLRIARCAPRSRSPVSLIVLTRSCSCRWGPCPSPTPRLVCPFYLFIEVYSRFVPHLGCPWVGTRCSLPRDTARILKYKPLSQHTGTTRAQTGADWHTHRHTTGAA